MGLLLYLGIHMLFVSLPLLLKKSFYNCSLRIMGAAFLFVPLSCFIYTPDKSLEIEPYISAAVNLSAYFTTFVLMVIAFLILLGKKFSKLVKRATIITLIAYPIPMWLSLMSGKHQLIDTVVSASYSYFVIIITLMVISVLRNCSKAIKNIDNYYSDDLHICVNWITRSIWLLIGLSINCTISPLLPISPNWLRFIFLVYGISCYLYIHFGYRRMMIAMIDCFIVQGHSVSALALIEQQSDTAPNLSSVIQSKIQTQLNHWISDKGYTHKGVTINMVAKEVGTNRTYLSRYINTIYKCSFKTWITQLRIEEAERLLLDDIELTINAVADLVGFASKESFVHIFSRIEGRPPSLWREKNNAKSNN